MLLLQKELEVVVKKKSFTEPSPNRLVHVLEIKETFESFSDQLSGGCRENWFIIFRLSSALKCFYMLRILDL